MSLYVQGQPNPSQPAITSNATTSSSSTAEQVKAKDKNIADSQINEPKKSTKTNKSNTEKPENTSKGFNLPNIWNRKAGRSNKVKNAKVENAGVGNVIAKELKTKPEVFDSFEFKQQLVVEHQRKTMEQGLEQTLKATQGLNELAATIKDGGFGSFLFEPEPEKPNDTNHDTKSEDIQKK